MTLYEQELNNLLKELGRVLNSVEAIPNSQDLLDFHSVTLPMIAFRRLKSKLVGFEKQWACVCHEINVRNCPVHQNGSGE